MAGMRYSSRAGSRAWCRSWRSRVRVVKVSRWSERSAVHGGDYDERWQQMQARGQWVHGEADLVCWFEPSSVLDAGCGTGRVAVELDRRGLDVVGLDLDPRMLAEARRKAPHLTWIDGDLVDVRIRAAEKEASAAWQGPCEDGLVDGQGETAGGAARQWPRAGSLVDAQVPAGELGGDVRVFDLIVMAGNVMIFVAPGTEAAVIANMARHLRPGGRLMAGFQLGRTSLALGAYDSFANDAGLVLEHRWSTWEREPYRGGNYAVSVHRLDTKSP